MAEKKTTAAVKTATAAEKAPTVKLTAAEEKLKQEIIGKVGRHFGKVMEEATPNMVYAACALTVRDQIMEKWAKSHKKVKEEGSKEALLSFI